MPFGESWELSSGSSVSSCWVCNETSVHKDIATLQLLHKVHSEKQSRPVRDVWHFALRLKTSLVCVCVRRPSVLLLTAAPVIPWSHDTPSQITVARQHAPTPLRPFSLHPHHPLPPFRCIQRWCRGRRGYSKRATFIFRRRGKRREPTCYSKIKPSVFPPTSPGPPSLSTSIFPPLSLSLCSLMRRGGSWDRMTRTARELERVHQRDNAPAEHRTPVANLRLRNRPLTSKETWPTFECAEINEYKTHLYAWGSRFSQDKNPTFNG